MCYRALCKSSLPPSAGTYDLLHAAEVCAIQEPRHRDSTPHAGVYIMLCCTLPALVLACTMYLLPLGQMIIVLETISSIYGCRDWMLEQQEHTCVGRSLSWQRSLLPCRSWASQAATSSVRASHSDVRALRAIECQRMTEEIFSFSALTSGVICL